MFCCFPCALTLVAARPAEKRIRHDPTRQLHLGKLLRHGLCKTHAGIDSLPTEPSDAWMTLYSRVPLASIVAQLMPDIQRDQQAGRNAQGEASDLNNSI